MAGMEIVEPSRCEIALRKLSPLFDELYAEDSRPSIPTEQLDYHLVYQWFPGMNMVEAYFRAATQSGLVARYWWERSIRQVETSRTLVLNAPAEPVVSQCPLASAA
jgi:hypothetical protein